MRGPVTDVCVVLYCKFLIALIYLFTGSSRLISTMRLIFGGFQVPRRHILLACFYIRFDPPHFARFHMGE